MHDDSELAGRRLSRDVLEERIHDETGDFIRSRIVRERVESWDGVTETLESTAPIILQCGHTHSLGQPILRCDTCSRKAGRTIVICAKCHVRCPMCGKSVCLVHSRPGEDGQRYCSKRCKRRGQKFFAKAPAKPTSSTPAVPPKSPVSPKASVETYPMPVARSTGSFSRFLGRVLEWW